jgi:tRNA(Ile)-lysidine synthase
MTALQQRIQRTCRRYGLLPPGSRVLIGVSGGSDSVALVRLLLDLSKHGEFAVAGLAHLNHRLRPSADRDEAFCQQFAVRLGLPIVMEQADIAAYAREHRLSTEDAARRVRYDFLERCATSLAADRIAVGHTQDDQAETFLLKLMRGAGLTGLGGIYPRRGRVIRPLLDVARADLREYLAAVGESWIEDETNDDIGNPRNRIRHLVLPELDRAAGAPTRAAIARAAAVIREDGEWLDALSRARFCTLACARDTVLELDAAALAQTPPPVLRRVLLDAMRQRAGGREVGLEHVEAVLALLGTGQGGVDVPGCRVEHRGGKLVLIQQGGAVR